MVRSRSPSRSSPDGLTVRRFPQRSPPRLLTDAACGGLQPPPAERLRRATPPSPIQHRTKELDPLHRASVPFVAHPVVPPATTPITSTSARRHRTGTAEDEG